MSKSGVKLDIEPEQTKVLTKNQAKAMIFRPPGLAGKIRRVRAAHFLVFVKFNHFVQS